MLAAKIKLQSLLSDYNLTLEDLTDDNDDYGAVIYGVRDKTINKLWAHIYYAVANKTKIAYRAIGTKRLFRCTEAQAIEILHQFEWHKKNFRKELRKATADLLDAYIIKHRLYPIPKSILI